MVALGSSSAGQVSGPATDLVGEALDRFSLVQPQQAVTVTACGDPNEQELDEALDRFFRVSRNTGSR